MRPRRRLPRPAGRRRRAWRRREARIAARIVSGTGRVVVRPEQLQAADPEERRRARAGSPQSTTSAIASRVVPGRAQPQPDGPDGDGRGRRREHGERAEEQVERVEVAEAGAPDERAGDHERDRAEVQAGLDRALLADHEPGDRRSPGTLPSRRKTIATVSRQNALNGDTLGDSPLLPTPCPVRRPQPTVATTAMPVASERPPPDGRDDRAGAASASERLADPDRPDAPDADQRRAGR